MPSSRLLVAVLLLLPALAGCLGASVEFEAEGARVSDDWAHDGVGVRNAEGDVKIRVSDTLNTGTVKGQVVDGATRWRFEWAEFQEFSPAHDGGVVRDLTEHGDTGVGGTVIPVVHLPLAGWGYAKLHQDGKVVEDATTGDDTLKAHFMVVDGQLRNERGRILTADGNGTYDPANPGDGRVLDGGPSVFVQLQNRDGSYVKVFEFRNVQRG